MYRQRFQAREQKKDPIGDVLVEAGIVGSVTGASSAGVLVSTLLMPVKEYLTKLFGTVAKGNGKKIMDAITNILMTRFKKGSLATLDLQQFIKELNSNLSRQPTLNRGKIQVRFPNTPGGQVVTQLVTIDELARGIWEGSSRLAHGGGLGSIIDAFNREVGRAIEKGGVKPPSGVQRAIDDSVKEAKSVDSTGGAAIENAVKEPTTAKKVKALDRLKASWKKSWKILAIIAALIVLFKILDYVTLPRGPMDTTTPIGPGLTLPRGGSSF